MMPGHSEERHSQGAVQQVLSPSAPCGLFNGRVEEGADRQAGHSVDHGGAQRSTDSGAMQQQELDDRLVQRGHVELQGIRAETPGVTEEPAAGPVQAEPMDGALTTLDLGGGSSADLAGAAFNAGVVSEEFRTSTTMTAPKTKGASAWLSGVEPPRWLQRLGSFLHVPGPGAYQVDFPPSPFPGASPPYTPPPPGGPTFRLRSPGRPKAIPAAPTPPTSSSVPAEAIQAEVQRQLGGIMRQLRDYSERNDQLQAELNEARAALQQVQDGNIQQEGVPVGHFRLLGGDLATARLDPGVLEGCSIPKDGPPPRLSSEPLFTGPTTSASQPPPRKKQSYSLNWSMGRRCRFFTTISGTTYLRAARRASRLKWSNWTVTIVVGLSAKGANPTARHHC